MKNRRDVCAASEAGYIEFESSPGVIKTGCQLSPGYKSKYCYEHAPRISQMTGGDDQASAHLESGVVRLITAKKHTRKETYYQVHAMYMYLYLLDIMCSHESERTHIQLTIGLTNSATLTHTHQCYRLGENSTQHQQIILAW